MIKAGFKLRRHCVAFVGSVALSMSMLMPTAQAADGDVTEYKLNNGLRIVVKEDHRSPTVAHMVWYKAGSIDEYNGTTGVAHVLEHMMFKGTKNLKVGEFSQTVAALGGRDNAFTSRDYTAYFQQLQAKDLGKVMALEADRMANLVLSDAIPKASLTAGTQVLRVSVPYGTERYLRLYFTVGTGPLTAGKFTSGLIPQRQANIAYASCYAA